MFMTLRRDYYVSSRYYDSKICRFISADAFASTGQGLLAAICSRIVRIIRLTR